MAYLTGIELNSALYPEIKAAILRDETEAIDIHINDALAFVQSKLSQKYDIITEFTKTGAERNNLILKYAKDIAIYFAYNITETMPAKRAKAYDDSVEYLDDAKVGKTIIPGLLPAPIPESPSKFSNTAWISNKKRYSTL